LTSPMIQRPGGISRTIFILGLIVVGAASGGIGYYLGGALKPAPTTPGVVYSTLNGAGATFPYPLLSAMSLNYSRQYPNIQINYNAIGSGGGINALIQKTVDFAASDAPLNDAQRGQATSSLHIPETIGAVVAAYNVPGVGSGLRLDGPTLVKIFQGNITYWDDPAIVSLQTGGVAGALQHKPLVYVHRADGSGTTFIFSKYLNSSAPCPSGSYCWKLGVGTSIGTWPGNSICMAGNGYCPIGSNGNAAVAGTIQGTQYTIGYVELNYALCPSRNAQGCTNAMSVAYVQNHDSTNFVKPSLTNVTYAVQNATNTALPAGDASWSSVSLLNAAGGYSYPIVSFTYLLVYKDLSVVSDLNKDSATALVNFLWWVIHQGQGLSPGLFYVPLPQYVVTVDEATIRSITFNGTQLHP
jgi:phosphate transport system substrate-binding protein